MLNMTFIGQSVPDIRRKLQHLDGALEMNPFMLVDIAFKVYHDQTLARWLTWLEHHPIHQRVEGLIHGQATNIGCGFDPRSGYVWGVTD